RQPLFEVQIAIFTPAEPRKSTAQGGEISLRHRVTFRQPHEHPNPPHPLRLLRASRERPRRSAAEQRDELAPPHHSITSSAICWRWVGPSRPSMSAVCALMTSSNLLDCTTGKSAGFAPLRMRPA